MVCFSPSGNGICPPGGGMGISGEDHHKSEVYGAQSGAPGRKRIKARSLECGCCLGCGQPSRYEGRMGGSHHL